MGTFLQFAEKPHFSPAEIGFFNETLSALAGQHVVYYLCPFEDFFLTGVKWWVDKTPIVCLVSEIPDSEELCFVRSKFVRSNPESELQTFFCPEEKLPKDCDPKMMPLAIASWNRLRETMQKDFQQNLKRFKIRGWVRHFRSIGSGDFEHEAIVRALNAEHAIELARPHDYCFVTSPALVELK